MAPITKDSDTILANGEATARSGAAPASPSDSPAKPQPVALEIPISVNGVRTMEGSDKREPFSESTKTVMVYGSGAVIRLTSGVAPGQLLFLTNERTKKEVVCQVVKSKNYRNVSGYVELEFTEPAVGFWGMRFPGDRIGPAPQLGAAPARPAASSGSPTPPRAALPKIETPAPNTISGNGAAKTGAPAPVRSNTVSLGANGSSIAPPPIDSTSLLAGSKTKPGNLPAPVKPVTTKLASDSGLVEPWLKKPAGGFKAPVTTPIAASPKSPAESSEPQMDFSIAPTFDSSSSSDKAASIFAPAEAPSNLANVDLSSLTPFFEVKPAAPADAPPPPPPQAPAATASDSETEELKQHTARLQEELSKMKFAEPAASSPVEAVAETPSLPVVELSAPFREKEAVHESPAQILEKPSSSLPEPILADLGEPTSAAPAEAEPEKAATPATPIPALESMEQEELKIPAWLEPLTRNAAAPSSTRELVLREKAKRAAEQPQVQEIPAVPLVPAEEQIVASRVPQFGSELPFDEKVRSTERSPRKSGKGLVFAAVAAGLALLAAAGWWYKNQQSTGVSASVAAPHAQAVSAPSENLQTNSPSRITAETSLAGRGEPETKASQSKSVSRDAKAPLNSANNVSNSAPAGGSAAAQRNAQGAPASNGLNGGSMVTTSASKASEAVPAEEKKPVLGEVRLAGPKVSQKKNAQGGAEADPGISLGEELPEADSDAAGASLGIANNQPTAPTAPVVVGGDVKPAKLISSVPPVYPALAKTERVSGDVTVDALIDANGRVTTMKILSGPTLLHQAAMDALKQWKYRPAMLDGKAVSMHLSVTIQFRLQQ
jgi:TonB family protein